MRVCVSFAAGPDVVDESHVSPLSRGNLGPQKRHRHWSPSHYFFLILAIASLGLYGYAYIARTLYQTYESWSFDQATDRGNVSVADPNLETTPIDSVVHAPKESIRPSPSKFTTSMIGRLSVSRLHLSAMVREGIDRNTLQLAVGHIPSTALPGQAGNVGVAGHRDTFFRGLKDLETKDEIQFSTSRGIFTYEVESLMVVEPDNVGVLDASHGNVLTLVTCYPFSYIGNAPKRFIVRARQVSPQTQSLSIEK
jgi:sortase A